MGEDKWIITAILPLADTTQTENARMMKREKNVSRYQERCCVWMSEILKNLYLFLRRLRLNIKLLSEKDFNNLLKDERLDYEQRLYLVYFRYM